jgi:hypothetical protein
MTLYFLEVNLPHLLLHYTLIPSNPHFLPRLLLCLLASSPAPAALWESPASASATARFPLLLGGDSRKESGGSAARSCPEQASSPPPLAPSPVDMELLSDRWPSSSLPADPKAPPLPLLLHRRCSRSTILGGSPSSRCGRWRGRAGSAMAASMLSLGSLSHGGGGAPPSLPEPPTVRVSSIGANAERRWVRVEPRRRDGRAAT